jgi:hypothetical protein
MKQFKVALCFSGQLRTWKQTIEQTKSFFHLNDSSDLQIDTFGHIWNYNTWIDLQYENVLNGPKYLNSYDEPIAESEIQEFIDTYKFKKIQIDNKRATHFSQWENPLYSFMRSMELKREYELENNFEYDLVIKTRTDAVWETLNGFKYEIPQSLSVTAGLKGCKMTIEYFSNDLNDVLFWGDSFGMDLLGNTYRWYYKNITSNIKINNYLPNQIANRKLGPGTALHKYAAQLGLFIYYDSNYPWKIVRKT